MLKSWCNFSSIRMAVGGGFRTHREPKVFRLRASNTDREPSVRLDIDRSSLTMI